MLRCSLGESPGWTGPEGPLRWRSLEMMLERGGGEGGGVGQRMLEMEETFRLVGEEENDFEEGEGEAADQSDPLMKLI